MYQEGCESFMLPSSQILGNKLSLALSYFDGLGKTRIFSYLVKMVFSPMVKEAIWYSIFLSEGFSEEILKIHTNSISCNCRGFDPHSKITAHSDCSHEIKRCLLLGSKVITNLHSILKSRDITLPTKVRLVKAMVFPVVMYECESWTVKKSWVPKSFEVCFWTKLLNKCFELWCWRRLLRVPWTARRSNQSILMEISPGCSLEGLMLELKLQYFGHLIQRVDSLEKTLMLGKIEGRRRRGRQRMRWLDGITDSIDMSLSNSGSWWWTGMPGVLQSMG